MAEDDQDRRSDQAEDEDIEEAGLKPAGGEGPETPEPAVDEEDAGNPAEPHAGDEETADEVTFTVGAANRGVVGELTLHYAWRDVKVVLDGEAAIRVLTAFWRRRAGPLADRLDPESSYALSGWLVFDLGEPLAASWAPSLGASPRAAFDPAGPQVA